MVLPAPGSTSPSTLQTATTSGTVTGTGTAPETSPLSPPLGTASSVVLLGVSQAAGGSTSPAPAGPVPADPSSTPAPASTQANQGSGSATYLAYPQLVISATKPTAPTTSTADGSGGTTGSTGPASTLTTTVAIPVVAAQVVTPPTGPTPTSSTTTGAASASTATSVYGIVGSDHPWRMVQLAMVNSSTGTLPLIPTGTTGSGGSSTTGSSGSWGQVSQGWLTLAASDQASAQALPDQQHVTVLGTLDLTHAYRVFEIPSDPRTRVLGIELTTATAAAPPGAEITLFDATGRPIAESLSSPDAGTLTMEVAVGRMSRSSGMYLKVGAPASLLDAPSTSAAAPDNFVLQVTRDPASTAPAPDTMAQASTIPIAQTDAASSATATATASHDEVVGSIAWEPSSLPSLEPVVLAPALVASGGSPGLSQPLPEIATGPLPERSGAALGGVLAEGDPIPQLDRHDAALVDLALIGLPEPLPGEGDADLAAVLADLDMEPQADSAAKAPLVAVRGPGGFPQMTVSLHREAAADINALMAVLPQAATATAMAARAPAPPSAPARSPAETTPEQPPLQPLRSAPALSGLSVAAAMVFNLLRPDLSALLTVARSSRGRLCLRLRRLAGRG
jgi:hypothetical protein